MRRFGKLLVFPHLALGIAAAVLVGGCKGSDDDVTLADFAGVWDAISYRVTSKANPAMTMDPIAVGGSMIATIDTEGRVTGTATMPDPAAGLVTLSWTAQITLLDQETIAIDFQPDIPPLLVDDTATFDLSGDTLVLENDDSTFDWDGDGTPEPSSFRIELRRR